MEILIISPKTSGIGGVAQHVSKLIELLRRRGFLVDYISTENTLYIPVKKFMNLSFTVSAILKTLIKRTHKEYEIVHAHNIVGYIPATIMKTKKVLTLHGVFSEQIGLLYGSMLAKISALLEYKAISSSDAITAVSVTTCKWYSRRGVKVLYIPNAVDLSDMPSRGIKLYERQAIFLGRLSKEKGVDILVHAFKRLKDVHLIILGDGPLRSFVTKAAEKYDNIHYLGYKPRSIALEYLKGSDVLVLPSRIEGTPTVLLEAMALKVPIVATNINGIREVLSPGKGILVELDNSRALTEAVRRVLEEDEERISIVERAYTSLLKRYTWDIVIEDYIRVYKQVLGET